MMPTINEVNSLASSRALFINPPDLITLKVLDGELVHELKFVLQRLVQ